MLGVSEWSLRTFPVSQCKAGGRRSYHLNEVGERSNGSVWLLARVGRDVPFVIRDTMGGEGAVGTLVKLARGEVALHESQGRSTASPRTSVAQQHL